MLMIVFGAGASFDSATIQGSGDISWRPPLANELFDDRPYFGNALDDFEDVRALATRLSRLPDGRSLEEELEELQSDAETYAPMRQQLMALRFYLQRIVGTTGQQWSNIHHGRTNYVGLAHTVDRLWTSRRNAPVCFVTFNYDVMLDGALGQIGVYFGDLGSYIANSKYILIKPHGSVNWWHPVTGPLDHGSLRIENYIAKHIDDLNVSSAFEVRTDAGSPLQPYLPALAIPVAKKTTFEFPDEHLRKLRRCIPEVTHLLLIGWRGNEANFVREVRENRRVPPKTLIVTTSADSARRVATTLQGDLGTSDVSGSDFSGFLRRRELDAFLLS